jgi:hypothetical protein
MLPIMRPMNESTTSRGRDVDEHARGPLSIDALGQVLLQRERELVVHVDLDRDEQVLAHLENRDAVHDA